MIDASVLKDRDLHYMEIKAHSYADKNADAKPASGMKTLTLAYDPLTMQTTFSNSIKQNNSVGVKRRKSYFRNKGAAELRVSFVLDDTIYMNPIELALKMRSDTTDKIIKSMIKQWYTNDSKTLQPNLLLIKAFDMPLMDGTTGGFWGQLLNMQVINKTINEQGERVKARVDCLFIES